MGYKVKKTTVGYGIASCVYGDDTAVEMNMRRLLANRIDRAVRKAAKDAARNERALVADALQKQDEITRRNPILAESRFLDAAKFLRLLGPLPWNPTVKTLQSRKIQRTNARGRKRAK